MCFATDQSWLDECAYQWARPTYDRGLAGWVNYKKKKTCTKKRTTWKRV